MIDVGEAVRARRIVRLGGGIAQIGDFLGLQATGDAHFVEVSVARKRKQAGVLIFPAETADAGLSGRFHDRHIENLAADFAVGGFALEFGKIDESLIGNGLDETVAKKTQRDAEGANCFGIRDAFLDFFVGEGCAGANGAVVDQRAARDGFSAVSDGDVGSAEVPIRAIVADAQFRNL